MIIKNTKCNLGTSRSRFVTIDASTG